MATVNRSALPKHISKHASVNITTNMDTLHTINLESQLAKIGDLMVFDFDRQITVKIDDLPKK